MRDAPLGRGPTAASGLLALLCALVAASGAACGAPPTATPDAATTCGDGILQTGESCEPDGFLGATDRCRNEPHCGDGRLDRDEACDDGNRVSGDGCSALCDSTEICGNGIVDLGEQCDDGNLAPGDGCDASCRREEDPTRCGDGVLDPWESCDDGNDDPGDGCDPDCQLEGPAAECGNGVVELGEQCDDASPIPFDGCDDACRLQQAFLLTSIGIAEASEGCDLAGPSGRRGTRDCRVDNKLGGLEALRNGLTLAFDFSINQGGILALLILDGLDDPRAEAPGALRAFLLDGEDGDSNPDNNTLGGAFFQLSGQDFGPSGLPEESFEGEFSQGWLSLYSPRFALTIGFHPERIPFEFVDAWLVANVRSDGQRLVELPRGWVCGSLRARSLTTLTNRTYLDMFEVFLNLDDRYASLLDIVVFSGAEGGAPVLQPDVDLDGDGLETYYDDDPEDGLWQIDRCVDGDGVTEYYGTDCVLHPSMADGFSLTLTLSGVWAQIEGVDL